MLGRIGILLLGKMVNGDFRLRKIGEKRGLSNLVSYVLLISLSLSLSVIVYGWLKFYVERDSAEGEDCPDGVNLIVSGYYCFGGADGNLTVSLKNKGLFEIDGFVLRVHNRTGAEFGFYVVEDEGVGLAPGEDYNWGFNFSDASGDASGIEDVTVVDVQPFVLSDSNVTINCEAFASQSVVCV